MRTREEELQAFEEWTRRVSDAGAGAGTEQEPECTSGSFVPVRLLYGPHDLGEDHHGRCVGFPGGFPFTRGIQPTMYRGRLWTMRQYAGFGTSAESNRRYRFLLEQGQTGLSVAFDLPTQIGYDSDSPMADGEVGRVGVAVDTMADMELLFEGIPPDRVSTSMTINAPAAILLAMYVAAAEKKGVDRRVLSGTIQNDILKEYAARGTYIYPPRPSMRLITDIFAFCAREMPRWNPISISGYHIREAGSTAAQEVGFTLADAIAYVEAAVRSGLGVDDFAGRLSFFFNAQSDLLEEVAKFRAARRLWARIMKDRFGARNPRSWMLRFHTQTAGSSLTAQQVDNNIVRVTIQTLAAVLGGTQSLHTNARDEALALPTAQSARTALRTQQIVAYESGVANTVDPLGGSYCVEAMTDGIEREAEELIARIDGMGGMVEAIESGYVQGEIRRAAYRYTREVEQGTRVVVGVNRFRTDEDPAPELQRLDPDVQRRQVEFLSAVRAGRDASAVTCRLEALREAARGESNLMPPILDAVRVYVSVGEISDVLRGVWGEYRERVVA
ncbi:MAG: methylmalonyl-CoA mutase family protein [Bacteroidota bacterium]